MKDYKWELEYLQKNTNNVMIYENKESLLTRLSENADNPETTYKYMKEELEYLENEECAIYSVDLGSGFPVYFDNPKEAYEYVVKN